MIHETYEPGTLWREDGNVVGEIEIEHAINGIPSAKSMQSCIVDGQCSVNLSSSSLKVDTSSTLCCAIGYDHAVSDGEIGKICKYCLTLKSVHRQRVGAIVLPLYSQRWAVWRCHTPITIVEINAVIAASDCAIAVEHDGEIVTIRLNTLISLAARVDVGIGQHQCTALGVNGYAAFVAQYIIHVVLCHFLALHKE